MLANESAGTYSTYLLMWSNYLRGITLCQFLRRRCCITLHRLCFARIVYIRFGLFVMNSTVNQFNDDIIIRVMAVTESLCYNMEVLAFRRQRGLSGKCC